MQRHDALTETDNMFKTIFRVALLALGWVAGNAMAAYSCSVSVTSITTVYSPTVATDNVTSGSFTITCTRLISDSATLNWSLGADNGLQPTGAQNRVQRGATNNRYNYETYRLTPYTNANRWQDNNATRFAGTMAFGGSLSASATGVFDLRVPGSQTVVTAGTYTDTVGVTLRNTGNGTTLASSSFGVTVITTNSCQISTAPGDLNFTYTSFTATPASASTNFAARCTTGLPYTMSLDATSGTLLGLAYTLALSATSATGSGLQQSFTITGGIAAGQAGTCSTPTCSGSQARTLTITY